MLEQAILWEYTNKNLNKKIKRPKIVKAKVECYSPKVNKNIKQ